MRVLFKKLHKAAKIPQYDSDKSSGFNLYAIESTTIKSLEVSIVQTGLSVELPLNTEMQIRPYQNLAVKFPGYISNSPGTIDEDYRGEIIIIIYNRLFNKDIFIKKHDKVALAIIAPVIRCTIEEGDRVEGYNMHDIEEADTKDGKGRI